MGAREGWGVTVGQGQSSELKPQSNNIYLHLTKLSTCGSGSSEILRQKKIQICVFKKHFCAVTPGVGDVGGCGGGGVAH